MKTLIKTILCVLIVYSTQVISSSLTFDFSNPSFSGEGYSSHVLSIEQLQYNRKESVKDDLLSAESKAARDAKNTTLAKFVTNVESRIFANLSKQMVDNMFGTTINYIENLFDVSGSPIVVDAINNYVNPIFPGIKRPEPIKENLEKLSERIKKESYALGLAFDLDGDRVGIVDENGDLADTLIFYFENKKNCNFFLKKYEDNGYGTKNVPEAIKWHFAGHMEHMFVNHLHYKENWNFKWKKSEDLLQRSISIPILVKSTIDELSKQIDTINKILSQI